MSSTDYLEVHIAEPVKEVEFLPVYICEIEISEPLPDLVTGKEPGEPLYQRAQCHIRLHHQPLGLVNISLQASYGKAQVYAKQIWQELGEQINAHLRQDDLPEVSGLSVAGLTCSHKPNCEKEREIFLQSAPFVSVVLCTRERPEQLARCIAALLEMHYPHYEVIVVDNAPATPATRDLMEERYGGEPKVRYMCEPRPGLSAGRNRGILEARGEIIAFTDDDVVVDSYWLAELVRGFTGAGDVACVTGLLLPLELETPAQIWFEEFGGFNKGFARRVFDRRSGGKDNPVYPFAAGRFGTGAAMAFTATFLKEEREFDCALGAGTFVGGGEDLVAFVRVIMRGKQLVYAPSALAYHQHRRDYASLRKQVFAYGASVTSYLTKIVIDHPWLLFSIIVRIPSGMKFLLSKTSTKNIKKSPHFPASLTVEERKGMVEGPFLYLKGRLKNARRNRSADA